MNSKFLTILLTINLTVHLLALSAKATTVASEAYKKPEVGYSEAHRKDKDFNITLQPVGIGPAGTMSNALTLGFFTDPNSIIEVEYLKGERFFFLGDIFGSLKNNLQSIAIYNKQFMGNTFYARYGGNYRWVDYEYASDTWFGGASDEIYSFKGSALVAKISFGNQWQWDGFTLGCDWVGVEIPLTKQINSESYSGSSATRDSLNTREDRSLKDVSVNFVHFYLGMSF